jgi:hypothetical protein
MKFTDYALLREGKETKDVKKTLSKIPDRHSDLVKDYSVSFQPGNGLKGDPKHIGYIDEKNKTIVIAAPWNHSREYTLLHEVGHAVWKYLVSKDKKEEWKKLLARHKEDNDELNQEHEEMFCMLYAQFYAKNKLKKYDHDELIEFVSKI